MKIRNLTVLAAVFAGGSLLAQHTQLSVGADGILPLSHFSEEYSSGVGPTIGFELPLGSQLAVTLQAGYDILLIQSEFSEVLKSASIIPVQAGLKYFFQESQHGVYAHAQVGAHIFTETFQANDQFGLEEEGETSTRLSWGIGAGYQLDKFDVGLRYNMMMPKIDNEGGKHHPKPYIGLHIAYLIPLGK